MVQAVLGKSIVRRLPARRGHPNPSQGTEWGRAALDGPAARACLCDCADRHPGAVRSGRREALRPAAKAATATRTTPPNSSTVLTRRRMQHAIEGRVNAMKYGRPDYDKR